MLGDRLILYYYLLYWCCEGPQRRTKRGYWALVSGTSVAPSQDALPMLPLPTPIWYACVAYASRFRNVLELRIELSRVELDIILE